MRRFSDKSNLFYERDSRKWTNCARTIPRKSGGYSCPLDDSILAENSGVVVSREFRGTLLCGEINVDDAEAAGVTLPPLGSVHEGPEKISPNRHAIGNSTVHFSQVPA